MTKKIDVEKDVLKRFLRYVRIDSGSKHESKTYPSSPGQLKLLSLLKTELTAIGLKEVKMDKHAYVTATLPPTSQKYKNVPVIGFLAHVDTSPDVSGKHVRPQFIHNYQGGPLVLPTDKKQIIDPKDSPHLLKCLGHDLVTGDGTTLLGADDKAGVAEIVTAVNLLLHQPNLPRGKVRVAFMPDEEIGEGTKYFDVKKFGADFAYTVDGGTLGDIEDETFCADKMVIQIKGHNIHPGYGKGKLVNAATLAARLLARLPQDSLSPETTEGREGFIYPALISGKTEQTEIHFYIRDFAVSGLVEKETCLRQLAQEVTISEPRGQVEVVITESYRNIKEVLDKYPHVVAFAEEAIKQAGITPNRTFIRGGTDGCHLSFKGLPTANIFAGGQNFHSKLEWISACDMAKASETIVNLIQIWAQNK